MTPRTIVVVNERSSGSRGAAGRLRAAFERHGVVVDDLIVARDHVRLCKAVKRAVRDGATRVVVGGGDGSMAAAVAYLARTEVTLGVLPLGTGNSFATTLGIAHDLDRAVRVIAEGHVARVDLGRVNETYFANFATIGLAADIARATPSGLKARVGPLAYAIAGLVPLLRSRAFRARLRGDAGRLDLRTQQIVVASGRFFGEQPLTPEASARDGKLSVYLDHAVSPLGVARTYAAMAIGRQMHRPGAIAFETSELVVETRPRRRISVDGDAAGKTPARFRVDPGALRVFVPRPGDDASR